MFERNKKDDEGNESQSAGRPDSDKNFGSFRSKASGRSGDSAVIGRSIQIDGDLRGDEDLRIEGDVSGNVELKNNALTIGKEGKVKADVYAKSIAVDGETMGDLYATERVTVHVNARVQGNIISPKVSIEEGARFKGSIEMDPAAVEKVLGTTTTSGADKRNAGNKSSATDTSKVAPKRPVKDSSANLNPPSGTS